MMFFALGHLIRLAVWAWPVWVAALIWWEAGQAALGNRYHDTIQVAAVGALFVPAFLFALARAKSAELAIVAALGAAAAGLYGLDTEYERLGPYVAAAGYSTDYLLTYLDYPLVAMSLLALFGPASWMLWLRHLHAGPDQGGLLGSARWMSWREARRMFGQGDLIVGEAYEPKEQPHLGGKAPLLRFDGSGHLLTVAGSGNGKTTSVAIPNCLSWQGSLVVHDPKGELAEACAPARRAAGRDVYVLNPAAPGFDSINVLDWLDPKSDMLIENAKATVGWLTDGREPDGQNAYFEQRGRDLALLFVLIVVCSPWIPDEQRSLALVDVMLSQVTLPQLAMIAEDKQNGELAGGEIATMAHSFAHLPADTFGHFISHAQNLLSCIKGTAMKRLVCGDGPGRQLRLAELASGSVDVFVGIPVHILDSNPGVARLLMGTLLNAVYHRKYVRGMPRTLFLLDEMPRLRYMALLVTARDFGRGAGITLWAIVQDLGQLEEYYQATGLTSWMENCPVKTFFGIGYITSAEKISRSLGQKTVIVRTTSRRWLDLFTTRSETPQARALLTPDELMSLSVDSDGLPDEQIILTRTQRPLRCGLPKYYRRPELNRQVASPT